VEPLPSAGLIPVEYRKNGQFPEEPEANPAAQLQPISYNKNGQFPEPKENPAANLKPVQYNKNGQPPESEDASAGLKHKGGASSFGAPQTHSPTSYMPPPLTVSNKEGVRSQARRVRHARKH